MKKLVLLISAMWLISAFAAETLLLWEKDVPFAKGRNEYDIPEIEIYLPENPGNKKIPAVVICPGGAYRKLSKQHEGIRYAQFLNQHGIAGVVLKYRIGSKERGAYRYPVPQLDAKRAVRLVRANAGKWNIDPEKIGIMGSSAGGHLAAMTAVKNDSGDPENIDPVEKVSSRPDFVILCYAQTSMDKRYGRCAGSRANLLGSRDDLIPEVAAYAHVSSQTPPCFLWHTIEDPVVPVGNALDFVNALEKHKVPFSLHIYVRGKHGIGLGKKDDLHPWTGELIFWLKEIHVL